MQRMAMISLPAAQAPQGLSAHCQALQLGSLQQAQACRITSGELIAPQIQPVLPDAVVTNVLTPLRKAFPMLLHSLIVKVESQTCA